MRQQVVQIAYDKLLNFSMKLLEKLLNSKLELTSACTTTISRPSFLTVCKWKILFYASSCTYYKINVKSYSVKSILPVCEFLCI